MGGTLRGAPCEAINNLDEIEGMVTGGSPAWTMPREETGRGTPRDPRTPVRYELFLRRSLVSATMIIDPRPQPENTGC
jgi:hypothetical protein